MLEIATVMGDGENAELSSWDAEPFLKKVTDIVPNLIYIFNQATQSNEYTNHSIAEALGYSAQEVQDMGADVIPRLCHPNDVLSIAEHFSRIKSLKNGEVAQLTYRMKSRRGAWVWFISHDTVFERDSAGKVLRHIGVASDITAQKEAEEAARTEHLKATATNDELRAFSYAISHDLKAPSNTLTLVLGELLAVHGETLADDAKELVEMALATAGRMGTLVDDVLNYTRVINQELTFGTVDLGKTIAGIIDDLQARIRRSEAQITIDTLPVVAADPLQMRVLFQNLIENALKFHRPDLPPQVRITACAAPDQKTVEIAVTDDGIGIDPDKHDQIFQIFQRLNTYEQFRGTGLGLAICRRIAANHGSTISIVSASDEGATFSVCLERA